MGTNPGRGEPGGSVCEEVYECASGGGRGFRSSCWAAGDIISSSAVSSAESWDVFVGSGIGGLGSCEADMVKKC
jgi:hypothetical protein